MSGRGCTCSQNLRTSNKGQHFCVTCCTTNVAFKLTLLRVIPPPCATNLCVAESTCHLYFLQHENLVSVVILYAQQSQLAAQHCCRHKNVVCYYLTFNSALRHEAIRIISTPLKWDTGCLQGYTQ